MPTTTTYSSSGTTGQRTCYAGIFTGRGITSRPHGMLISDTPALPPGPATVAALPVGRRFLTSTTREDFDDALAWLATAWRAAGFGDVTDEPTGMGTCPAADNTPTGECTDHCYTFDDGQVLYYTPTPGTFEGRWHTITVSDPAGQQGAPVVTLTPAARAYGARYADTAALDLPQLAVWLLAELTHATRGTASPRVQRARYAAAVNTARDEIRLYIYGIDNTDGDRDIWTEDDHRALTDVLVAVRAHNWTNPYDPGDCRFHLHPSVVTEHDAPIFHTRGRLPGTVTVIDDTNALWA